MNTRLCVFALLAVGAGSVAVFTACPPAQVLAAAAPESGRVNINKMGGDIDVPDAPDGADVATMGGNIHIGNVRHSLSAKTMGGNIVVEHADGSVEVSTMGGTITLRQVSGQVQASTMAGDVTVHLTGPSGDRRDIHLSSMSGVILLTVPKDYGMDVRINHEDTSTGVNGHVMGRQKNSFPSVDKGDKVVPKRRQQRLPLYGSYSTGWRFIILFDTLHGMKIDEIGNLTGARRTR